MLTSCATSDAKPTSGEDFDSAMQSSLAWQASHCCGRVLVWAVAFRCFCGQRLRAKTAKSCEVFGMRLAAMPGGQADSGARLAMSQALGPYRMMLGMSLTRGILLLYAMLRGSPSVACTMSAGMTLTQAKAVNVSTHE